MAAVIERAELHKTIWRIANDLRGLFGGAYEYLMTMYASSAGKPDAPYKHGSSLAHGNRRSIR
ncbi:MAG: hypothetical protein KH051_09320 [Actinomyces sp.]|nr:hypothetical protein [Actinomyces sp.]